jgi:DNA replication protein DnaC
MAKLERLTMGLSTTSVDRYENRQCKCGKEFAAAVYKVQDGAEFEAELCDDCKVKLAEQELQHIRQEELTTETTKWRDFWRKEYGVEGIFAEKTLKNFNGKLQPRAFKAMLNWNGESYVLASPNVYGVGKTHLVTALANRLIEATEPVYFDEHGIKYRNCPVYYTNESHLMGRIRATYEKDAREKDEEILSRLGIYRLLIIDDVGKVRPRDPSFLQGIYFRVIDDRYTSGKAIILTTNLDPKDFGEHIHGACADRLREMCGRDGVITMTGESYRRR